MRTWTMSETFYSFWVLWNEHNHENFEHNYENFNLNEQNYENLKKNYWELWMNTIMRTWRTTIENFERTHAILRTWRTTIDNLVWKQFSGLGTLLLNSIQLKKKSYITVKIDFFVRNFSMCVKFNNPWEIETTIILQKSNN